MIDGGKESIISLNVSQKLSMKINLQGKNIELTDAIKDHIMKNVTNLEKLVTHMEKEGTEGLLNFEVSKSTNHHKSGVVFHSDCFLYINGEKFYSSADEEDLYQAVDAVRESLFRDIARKKDREQTLFKRGALSVKKMMKRLTKRDPMTAKY